MLGSASVVLASPGSKQLSPVTCGMLGCSLSKVVLLRLQMIRCICCNTVRCLCCSEELALLPPFQIVNRWLSLRLELLGIGIVFGAALFVSVLLPRNAGLAGLALTSALNLTGQRCNLHAEQVLHTDAMPFSRDTLREILCPACHAPGHLTIQCSDTSMLRSLLRPSTVQH